jgi:hypothetical protein
MEYIVPEFTTLPTDDELEALLDIFIEVFGLSKFKAGVTRKDQLLVRYAKKTIFKKLTMESVFCEVNDGELANQIEAKLIAILRKRGICENAKMDSGAPGTVSKGQACFVYLTEKKDDDAKCQLCAKVWIEDKEGQRKHMEEIHWEEILVFTQAIKDLEAREEDNSELIASYRKVLRWQHLEPTAAPAIPPVSAPPSTSGVGKKKSYDDHIIVLDSDSD